MIEPVSRNEQQPTIKRKLIAAWMRTELLPIRMILGRLILGKRILTRAD